MWCADPENVNPGDLNYGAGSAAALFDVFAAGPGGSDVVQGREWTYATGLGGTAGEVFYDSENDIYSLQLDASGNGVQGELSVVPEPAGLGLLGLALLG